MKATLTGMKTIPRNLEIKLVLVFTWNNDCRTREALYNTETYS